MGRRNESIVAVSASTITDAILMEASTAGELVEKIHTGMEGAVSKYGDRWKTISVQSIDIVQHRRFFRTTWIGIVYFSVAAVSEKSV